MDWKTHITRAQARRGLTQRQLADLVGCSQAYISKLVSDPQCEPRYSIGRRLIELSNGSAPNRQPITRKPRRATTEAIGEVSHA